MGPPVWRPLQGGAGGRSGHLALPDARRLHSPQPGPCAAGPAEEGAKCVGLSMEQRGGRLGATARKTPEVVGCRGRTETL